MEEKKEYSVIGTVTIGTDEYRDLIEQKIEAEKSTDYYRNKYWEEQKRASELTNKIAGVEEKIAKCEKIIANYKKAHNIDDTEDNTITLFMHIFGEE